MLRSVWTVLFLGTLLCAPFPGMARPSGQEGTLRLEHLWSVGDDGNGFNLSNPQSTLFSGEKVLVRDLGSLWLLDGQGKVLQHIKRQGQGPGEWHYLGGALPYGNGFVVFATMPNHLIVFDDKGQFVQDRKLIMQDGLADIVWVDDRGGYAVQTEMDFAHMESGEQSMVSKIGRFDENGVFGDQPLVMNQRSVQKVIKNKNGQMQIHFVIRDPLHFAVNREAGLMALSWREAWQVDLVDLKSGKVLKTVKRDLPPVPFTAHEDDKVWRAMTPPQQFHDILQVLAAGDEFWLIRSDITPEGVLVDRLGTQGELRGSFRLALPGLTHPWHLRQERLAVFRDRLAWVHQDEEENYIVSAWRYTLP